MYLGILEKNLIRNRKNIDYKTLRKYFILGHKIRNISKNYDEFANFRNPNHSQYESNNAISYDLANMIQNLWFHNYGNTVDEQNIKNRKIKLNLPEVEPKLINNNMFENIEQIVLETLDRITKNLLNKNIDLDLCKELNDELDLIEEEIINIEVEEQEEYHNEIWLNI